MAEPGGRKAAALIDLLVAQPTRFEAAQAIRILERVAGADTGLRFHGSPSLGCPEGAIAAVQMPGTLPPMSDPARARAFPEREIGEAIDVTINHLTLAGANGPLPPPFTEELNARLRRGDTALRDFLDIFQDRFVKLGQMGAKLFRPELSDKAPDASPLAGPLLALLGLMRAPAGGRLPVATILPLAGLLNHDTLSAHAIERGVSAWTGLPARVRPFRGGWLPLARDQQSRLGRANVRLGRTATLGRKVWDPALGITLELGPLPLARAEPLLPGRAGHARLRALIDRVVDDRVRVTLRLRLDPATVPDARLDKRQPPRLGWTSRLRAAPGQRGAARPPMRIDVPANWMAPRAR